MFMIGCGLIACGWGGTWASYPAITSEFWGPENLGANYGLVFIGASIGRIRLSQDRRLRR